MTSEPEWPTVGPASFDGTHRLIPGEYTEEGEHVLSLLSDSDRAREDLIRLAGATNARLQAQEETHPSGLSRTDMVFGVPYSRIVNGAFANPGLGARFHPQRGLGAWYCATEIDTCIAEVIHHRVKHLAETGLRSEADIPYREFLADVHAQDFLWLTDAHAQTQACLDPNSYTAGQQLASTYRPQGASGVVYPSVRHPSGTCLAVWVAPIVGNVRRHSLHSISIEDGRLANWVEVAPTGPENTAR